MSANASPGSAHLRGVRKQQSILDYLPKVDVGKELARVDDCGQADEGLPARPPQMDESQDVAEVPVLPSAEVPLHLGAARGPVTVLYGHPVTAGVRWAARNPRVGELAGRAVCAVGDGATGRGLRPSQDESQAADSGLPDSVLRGLGNSLEKGL